jgi:hypothetical protein
LSALYGIGAVEKLFKTIGKVQSGISYFLLFVYFSINCEWMVFPAIKIQIYANIALSFYENES